MQLYALKIRKADLALIALLNRGEPVAVTNTTRYFVFDATWNSDVPNRILSERQLATLPEIKSTSPFLIAFRTK